MTSTTQQPELERVVVADETRRRLPARTWRSHVTDVVRDTNAVSLEAIGTSERRASDLTIGVVLLITAVCVIGIEYFGRTFEPQWLQSTLRAMGLDGAADQVGTSILGSSHGKFWGLTLWASVRTFFYIAVPLVGARVLLGLRPGDLGVRVRGTLRHAGPYAVLFVGAAPFLTAASFGPAFQDRYPFYDPLPGEGLWPYVVAWWAIYAIQFVGVEIFFRGFLVLGLAPRMGIAAVYVSMVPYVMIHFGKPLPETVGAIVAGVVLGHLALKYRSIWWGAVLHIAAAVSFDLLALWHQDFF